MQFRLQKSFTMIICNPDVFFLISGKDIRLFIEQSFTLI